jgi:hypothetical protein
MDTRAPKPSYSRTPCTWPEGTTKVTLTAYRSLNSPALAWSAPLQMAGLDLAVTWSKEVPQDQTQQRQQQHDQNPK